MKISQNKNNDKQECIYNALEKFFDNIDDNWNYITPKELKKKGVENFFILDVRKQEDFQEAHIKNATNIFWQELIKKENLAKLPKDKPIIIVCYVGHTASQVLVALKMLGYNAVALKFGMGQSPDPNVPVAGWMDYNFPTAKA